MQEELSYEQAVAQLEELAEQMEEGAIGIEQLSERLRDAHELLFLCRNRLLVAEKNCKNLLDFDEKE